MLLTSIGPLHEVLNVLLIFQNFLPEEDFFMYRWSILNGDFLVANTEPWQLSTFEKFEGNIIVNQFSTFSNEKRRIQWI